MDSLPRPKTQTEAYQAISKIVAEVHRSNPGITWGESLLQLKTIAPESWFKYGKSYWGSFVGPVERAYSKLYMQYSKMDKLAGPTKPVDTGMFEDL